jgi:hypothetical protein
MNSPITRRSYGIPGSYAPTGSEKWLSFLRLLKNNGFKEGTGTKILLDAIETATPLESNKSLFCIREVKGKNLADLAQPRMEPRNSRCTLAQGLRRPCAKRGCPWLKMLLTASAGCVASPRKRMWRPSSRLPHQSRICPRSLTRLRSCPQSQR